MPSIHVPRDWELPEKLVTPESVYMDRRRFLHSMGVAGGALLFAGCANSGDNATAGSSVRSADSAARFAMEDFPGAPGFDLYPAARNTSYKVDRPFTDEEQASRYNNFYEFTTQKDVYRYVGDYEPYPWTLEVGGSCRKGGTWDLNTLMRRFPLEERVYRFRCVEAWSMVVPWTGFPLAALIQACEPEATAKYVKFTSFLRPDEAPGQKNQTWYRWPYYEGLRMDEAMNELAFFTTGIYGHPLPKQNGAPWRLVLPWKYGYKGSKAIVRIDFVERQPATFWNDSQPKEYGFYSNVNPSRPHPRWSQARERVLGSNERIPTLRYNGYEAQVASLYPGKDPF